MPDIKKKTKKIAQKKIEEKAQPIYDDYEEIGDDGKLTLGDIFESLGTSKLEEKQGKKGSDEVVNASKLQKQIKDLRKEAERDPALG